jgi:hypothetical protein
MDEDGDGLNASPYMEPSDSAIASSASRSPVPFPSSALGGEPVAAAAAAAADAGSRVKWNTRIRKAVSLSSKLSTLLKPRTLPPYASFVSRQLHRYLLAINPDEVEVATASTKPVAVLFSDASGFTALTERLSSKENGAEELSMILNEFFTRALDIIERYGGDVVKVPPTTSHPLSLLPTPPFPKKKKKRRKKKRGKGRAGSENKERKSERRSGKNDEHPHSRPHASLFFHK